MHIRHFSFIFGCALLAPWTGMARAEENPANLAPLQELAPFAKRHCLSCHDKKTIKGGFDLETLLGDATIEKSPAAWHSVLERIVSRDMPPKSRKERPSEGEYQKSEDWLRGQIQAQENFASSQRPRPMRRLNRDEYNHTIQEVFGLPGCKPADAFPPDDAVEGFTNIGEGLNLSTVLVEKYLTAGRAVAEQALLEDLSRPRASGSLPTIFTRARRGMAYQWL